MFIGIIMIIAGVWLTRIANRILIQRRKEWFAHLEFERKIIDNALNQIDTQNRDIDKRLELLSDRISRNEESGRDREEIVLRDFKRMLCIQ